MKTNSARTEQRNRFHFSQTQRYAFWGIIFGFLFPALATMINVSVAQLPLKLSSVVDVQRSDPLMWIIDTAPLFLGLFAALAGRRQNMLENSNFELRLRENELESIRANLEQHVEERTAELSLAKARLEKRATHLRAIAEVSRTAASIETPDRLLSQIAILISQQFGYYHVGVFLLDEQGQYAILRAANTEGGLKMLARAYRLQVEQQSVICFVIRSGKPRVALGVDQDADFIDNPDLQESRSELVLPLKAGGRIIGALDIHSKIENDFTEEDVSTLSILADQLAIAIQNARLLEQEQRALHEADISARQLTDQTWQEYTRPKKTKGYRYNGIKSEPLDEANESTDNKDTVRIPIELRGHTIGSLKLIRIDASKQWTDDELAIAQATADRVALALENARLLEDAQRHAGREHLVSAITGKIRSVNDPQLMIQVAAEELRSALGASQVKVVPQLTINNKK